VSGNNLAFRVANTFSGGLTTIAQKKEWFRVVAAANQCFGKGPVLIGDFCSLVIKKDLGNTIADDVSLSLKGLKGTEPTKLVLDSDETVGKFVIDEKDQGKGVFTKTTHPDIISGDGKLTVE
jgi:hypothetical protein